jgi:hypothetical protein
VQAELIISLCDRWHKTPDEILAMDASALRMLRLVDIGKEAEPDG